MTDNNIEWARHRKWDDESFIKFWIMMGHYALDLRDEAQRVWGDPHPGLTIANQLIAFDQALANARKEIEG